MIEGSLISTNPMIHMNWINEVGKLKTFPNPFKKLQNAKYDVNELPEIVRQFYVRFPQWSKDLLFPLIQWFTWIELMKLES